MIVAFSGQIAFVCIRNEDKVQVVVLATRAIVAEFFVRVQPYTL